MHQLDAADRELLCGAENLHVNELFPPVSVTLAKNDFVRLL